MAYRRSKGKARRKLQPAVMQLSFVVPSGTSYIDLALAASIANRRGYKQECTSWAVSQFELFNTPSATGLLYIKKAPQTWIVDNAYTKSKTLYDKMNDQVLLEEPDIQGTYSDFKIGLDYEHVSQSIQDNRNPSGRILTPVALVAGSTVFTEADFNGPFSPVADWDLSTLKIPNDPASGVTTEYTMHLVGGDQSDSKGLIAGYEKSRSRPQPNDPNVPTVEGWMNDLFDDGEQLEDIRDDLVSQNDRAPYPVGENRAAYYPGGSNEFAGLQIHSFCNFTSTTIGGKATIAGGIFDFGLMKIINETENVVSMVIHMVPGSHRGYMVEMI